ncbi:helix-turn-helix domain-containing protein [Christiangramia echinicola]|uniref:helix-turn-helix domain-containing protein n=1 Tax=Christiangramia echinicola TaxID=279359 RepID=UPI0003F4D291|nr:helix-turn-helix domain-containing protein [Christiangramia echinicola]
MEATKEKLASLVKGSRREKGLTQAKLAEITGLSLRSIQRIEKAEVYPRDYTLNKIMEVLQIPLYSLDKDVNSQGSLGKKIILSVSSGLIILLLSMAFISQSPTFPETHFELYLFWSAVVILISLIQWMVWNEIFARLN